CLRTLGLGEARGQEAATSPQSAKADATKSSAKEVTNTIGMKLRLIPAGALRMGSPASELGAGDEHSQAESPEHPVRITRPFYIGVYEVTQAEYQQVIGSNPSHFSAGGEGRAKVAGQDTARFPVEQVSWDEACEFCRRLGEKEERIYRLPT